MDETERGASEAGLAQPRRAWLMLAACVPVAIACALVPLTSLRALGAPLWLALAAAITVFPVLPLLWHLLAERRRARLVGPSGRAFERLALRCLAVGLVVLAVSLGNLGPRRVGDGLAGLFGLRAAPGAIAPAAQPAAPVASTSRHELEPFIPADARLVVAMSGAAVMQQLLASLGADTKQTVTALQRCQILTDRAQVLIAARDADTRLMVVRAPGITDQRNLYCVVGFLGNERLSLKFTSDRAPVRFELQGLLARPLAFEAVDAQHRDRDRGRLAGQAPTRSSFPAAPAQAEGPLARGAGAGRPRRGPVGGRRHPAREGRLEPFARRPLRGRPSCGCAAARSRRRARRTAPRSACTCRSPSPRRCRRRPWRTACAAWWRSSRRRRAACRSPPATATARPPPAKPLRRAHQDRTDKPSDTGGLSRARGDMAAGRRGQVPRIQYNPYAWARVLELPARRLPGLAGQDPAAAAAGRGHCDGPGPDLAAQRDGRVRRPHGGVPAVALLPPGEALGAGRPMRPTARSVSCAATPRCGPAHRGASARQRLPRGLLAAVVQVESRGRPHRISSAGAMGPGPAHARHRARPGRRRPVRLGRKRRRRRPPAGAAPGPLSQRAPGARRLQRRPGLRARPARPRQRRDRGVRRQGDAGLRQPCDPGARTRNATSTRPRRVPGPLLVSRPYGR